LRCNILRKEIVRMQTRLDWSAYEGGDFGIGFGDPIAPAAEPGSGFAKAAGACQGKRQCQRLEPGVMCPSYRVTRDPRHSTEHRALTLRAALDGALGPRPFVGPELRAALELCVGCKGCKRECPNGVDMALLAVEARARRWEEAGRMPLRERLLAGVPRLAPWLARLRGLLRLRNRWPVLARLSERVLGISARRSLPVPVATSYLAARTDEVVGGGAAGEVVLLVDSFSNHFEPDNAAAAVEVLSTAGYRVHLARPPAGERALCCGRTYLSGGQIETARTEARRLLRALSPFVERGLPVIGLEPSCLLMLRDEYHALGLGSGVGKLASAALLLEEFLARESAAGRLKLALAPQPGARVLVHGHCHQKAFGAMAAMDAALKLIPGLQVEVIESSCCGMAGGFGLEAEHFDISMAMGELALLPAVRAAAADTAVVANGTSCRQQIRDGAGREARHLAQLLRDALALPPAG
jgi:Fe-S oxidoreductase